MRVYLAARYSRRVELCGYREELREVGIAVTSNWLDGPRQRAIAGKVLGERDEAVIEAGGDALKAIELRRMCAVQDVEDVRAADTFVTFTELPDARAGRGGRHVEFGLALAAGKRIIVIGPVENVFHALAGVERFERWDEALEALVDDVRTACGFVGGYEAWNGPFTCTLHRNHAGLHSSKATVYSSSTSRHMPHPHRVRSAQITKTGARP